MAKNVFILGGARTPMTQHVGALKDLSAIELGAIAAKGAFERTGTSPDYARKRVKDHLLRFIKLHEQLTAGKVDEIWLTQIEAMDNIFPEVNWRYWT